MAISLRAFRNGMKTIAGSYEEKVLRPTLDFAANRIGARATTDFMTDRTGERPYPSSEPIYKRSRRLARSLITGSPVAQGGDVTGTEHIREISDQGGGTVELVVGSSVEYARIHEKGGIIRITPRMRGFLLRKAAQTGEKKWEYMAFARGGFLRIPERPYLGPALDAERREITKETARQTAELMREVLT